MKQYNTGGKHEPTHSSEGGSACNVAGASMGTHSGPNTKADGKPGGQGSTGGKSTSKAS